MGEQILPTFPTHEFEAGGKSWRITALGSKQGLSTLVKLSNLIGPAIAQLGEPGGAVAATGMFFARVTEKTAQDLVDVFMSKTEVEREHGMVRVEKLGVLREELFAADFGTLFQVIAQHVELNYSNFLGALDAIAPQPSASRGEGSAEAEESEDS
jgi:hypothetical protein